ncbi:hypothetical protein ACG873_15965 [Mesorhizobium sp. AaZ16]|uniref:hypothetical protein n=1 Tax=Mesorhizobium sp. AaZ16 TaxID=3402289 RepID=UPI00374F65BE
MGPHIQITFAVAIVAAVAGPAQAQTLALEGAWGNEAGCKFVRDGNYDNDEMLVLKAEGVERYVIGCDWLQVSTAKDGTQVATGLCSHEGEDYRTVETFIVEKDMTDPALTRIRASNGEPWGEVRKCP